MISRRQALAGGLASACMPWPRPGYGQQKATRARPVYISDMHFHSFFGDSIYHSRPVGTTFANGQATLVSWSVAGDPLWFDYRKTFKQHSEPKPGEALRWFRSQLAHIKAHMAEQGLAAALRPEDVDRALQGEPHVVLSLEGAALVERTADVQILYDAGIRHLQLVHYIRSPLGDFQTSPPTHNGLTELGRAVIAECNRLGILIDLAHCTPATVQGALAASKVPMVWSHGSVTIGADPHPGLITWKARQLSLRHARTIADAGGVVGLWALSPDVGKTPENYGHRLLQLADWLGEEHVAFGTDINGLAKSATLSTYAEVRRIIEGWQRAGVPDRRIRRIASENYARVLRRALTAKA